MAALSARRVEHTSSYGKSQDVDDPRHLGAIALRSEDRCVLEKVLRIEIAFPPLRAARQKKTFSRYAPNTDSMAARISYQSAVRAGGLENVGHHVLVGRRCAAQRGKSVFDSVFIARQADFGESLTLVDFCRRS